jgi:hypothetical protein
LFEVNVVDQFDPLTPTGVERTHGCLTEKGATTILATKVQVVHTDDNMKLMQYRQTPTGARALEAAAPNFQKQSDKSTSGGLE